MKCSIRIVAAAATLMLCGQSGLANSLVNPGFESPAIDPTGPPEFAGGGDGWNPFGQVFTTDATMVPAGTNSGDQMLKLFGGGANGVFQEFPASPGELWDAGAWILNDSNDALAGGQVAGVNIEWHDDNGQIGFIPSATLSASSPTDVWTLQPVSGTAPAGTTRARIVLITGDFADGGPGGAPRFDDAFFAVRIPEPTSLVMVGIGLVSLVGTRRRTRS